jgi:hypothetical protein
VDIKEKLKQNEAIIIKADKENSVIVFEEKDCGEKVKQSIDENCLMHVDANLTVNFRQLVEET